jgi:hypothetical protein
VSLSRASRLGPYEIVSPLGASGIGEAYRARDTKLELIVATQDRKSVAFEHEFKGNPKDASGRFGTLQDETQPVDPEASGKIPKRGVSLPKVDVAGSTPVSRSNRLGHP